MENYLDQGYCLYTDNFLNSFELAKYLITNKTYNCGTLRSDRRSNPKEVTKFKLKKEEIINRSREAVIAAKWKEKQDVLMVSNMHKLKMVEVPNKQGKKNGKPDIFAITTVVCQVLIRLIKWYCIMTA